MARRPKGTQFNFTDHVSGNLSTLKGKFNWKFGFERRWMRTTGIKLSTGGFDDAGVQGDFLFQPNANCLSSCLRNDGRLICEFLAGTGQQRIENLQRQCLFSELRLLRRIRADRLEGDVRTSL